MSRFLKGIRDRFASSRDDIVLAAEQERLKKAEQVRQEQFRKMPLKQASAEEMDIYNPSSQFSSMSISSTTTNGLLTDSDSSNDLQQAQPALLASAHPCDMDNASDSDSMIAGLNIQNNKNADPNLNPIKSFKPQFSPKQSIPGAIPRDFPQDDSEDETNDDLEFSEHDDEPSFFPGDFDDLPKKTDLPAVEPNTTLIEQDKQPSDTPAKKIPTPNKATKKLNSSAPELSYMDDFNDEKWVPSLYRRKTDADKNQSPASVTVEKDGRKITYGFSPSKD